MTEPPSPGELAAAAVKPPAAEPIFEVIAAVFWRLSLIASLGGLHHVSYVIGAPRGRSSPSQPPSPRLWRSRRPPAPRRPSRTSRRPPSSRAGSSRSPAGPTRTRKPVASTTSCGWATSCSSPATSPPPRITAETFSRGPISQLRTPSPATLLPFAPRPRRPRLLPRRVARPQDALRRGAVLDRERPGAQPARRVRHRLGAGVAGRAEPRHQRAGQGHRRRRQRPLRRRRVHHRLRAVATSGWPGCRSRARASRSTRAGTRSASDEVRDLVADPASGRLIVAGWFKALDGAVSSPHLGAVSLASGGLAHVGEPPGLRDPRHRPLRLRALRRDGRPRAAPRWRSTSPAATSSGTTRPTATSRRSRRSAGTRSTACTATTSLPRPTCR